jgi:hypothetical protein
VEWSIDFNDCARFILHVSGAGRRRLTPWSLGPFHLHLPARPARPEGAVKISHRLPPA